MQTRLVTELPTMAGARQPSSEADGVTAAGFLPRFNTRFAVPPQSPEAAYRPLALRRINLDPYPLLHGTAGTGSAHRQAQTR